MWETRPSLHHTIQEAKTLNGVKHMIESIELKQTATYGSVPQNLSSLAKFNFIFGGNGTGKTTISRVIADDSRFPACGITWKDGVRCETLVYNRDFVERNFNQSPELKGIFTLGENRVETMEKIATLTDELEKTKAEIRNLSATLRGEDGKGGKKHDLTANEESVTDICWPKKQQYDKYFTKAFEGCRGSKKDFRERVLQELRVNSAALETFESLSKRADALFKDELVELGEVPNLDVTAIVNHERNPILGKRIIGKQDVDIAGMIEKLGNSDWVQAGRSFYDRNDLYCPFCQQRTTEAFRSSLEEFFDESFLRDIKEIKTLEAHYRSGAEGLRKILDGIEAARPRYLDMNKLAGIRAVLEARVSANLQLIKAKREQPSTSVELDAVEDVLSSIAEVIDAANREIENHNALARNAAHERRLLTDQIWRFIVEELKPELLPKLEQRSNIQKAIDSLEDQLHRKAQEQAGKESDIRMLQRDITSVRPTIDGINGYLRAYGFRGFLLDATEDGTRYRLVRPDGTNAMETLSERERTLLTFLYFYHSLHGSLSEAGAIGDRVVVFDDPVSSLDSDVLFLVVGMIRQLFQNIRAGSGFIKQLFVMTHNVYFHKEITYKPEEYFGAGVTFWVVRKRDLDSMLDGYGKSNPITTSYHLLWREIGRRDRSNLTLQNVMRRVLEQYFKILGGMKLEEIANKFAGREQIVCRSLLSWMNDGSHAVIDDLYVTMDDATVDLYLHVFKQIFYRLEHGAHYDMMMAQSTPSSVQEASV